MGHTHAADTLHHTLRSHAERHPEKLACTHQGKQAARETLTYEELHLRVLHAAANIGEKAKRNDRVLLLLPHGLDFIVAFLACQAIGAIPVPAAAPRRQTEAGRVMSLVRDAVPALALASDTSFLKGDSPCLGESQVALLRTSEFFVPTDEALQKADAAAVEEHEQSIGLLQYTSGSTGNPRGVVISHANLAANFQMIQAATGADSSTVVASWLPMYHDMGLIGTCLAPLFWGATVHLLDPLAFIQRPIRWLELINDERVQISGGPNFAFDHCVDRTTAQERASVDLSSWEVALCGSEPVRARTLERFAAAFAPQGFSKRALWPCYGLAEATLFVTGPDRAQQSAEELVALSKTNRVPSGRPWLDSDVVVVDSVTKRACAQGVEGEIWVRGPHIATGYWSGLEPERFNQYLGDDGPYLTTGDLGVMVDGVLTVTGRLSDLIIIRGRNIHPEDVEAAGRAADSRIVGATAAFSVEVEDLERVVLVQELDREPDEPTKRAIAQSIRANVAQVVDVELYAVILARRGSVPRTTSGKVRRGMCRDAFQSGTLARVVHASVVAGDRPVLANNVQAVEEMDSIGEHLRERLAVILGLSVSSIALDDTLIDLGVTSIQALDFKLYVEDAFGVELPLEALADELSISALGELLMTLLRDDRTSAPAYDDELTARLNALSSDEVDAWLQRLARAEG